MRKGIRPAKASEMSAGVEVLHLVESDGPRGCHFAHQSVRLPGSSLSRRIVRNPREQEMSGLLEVGAPENLIGSAQRNKGETICNLPRNAGNPTVLDTGATDGQQP